MGRAFNRCGSCPYPYRRIYAQGGNYVNDASAGLYSGGSKSDFIACYMTAIALVNSIDITTVPLGKIRWFDFGGQVSAKSDCTYVDWGNIPNNPTHNPPNGLIGHGDGTVPANATDYGAIVGGGSELSYMGLDNPTFGVNAGGYQQAYWGVGVSPPSPAKGGFAISRIMVDVSVAACSDKWSLVYYEGTPFPGAYTIECQCDATTFPGGCPGCINGSATGELCVDIPDPSWFTQNDASLPCSAQFFVPGFNCADLT